MRDRLIELLNNYREEISFCGRCDRPSEECESCIDEQLADYLLTNGVVEVRHGEWVRYWDDNYLSWCHKCSECGNFPLTKEETMHDEVLSAYCPHCGTKMGGKNENLL